MSRDTNKMLFEYCEEIYTSKTTTKQVKRTTTKK